jgi:hypothetical protein
MRHPEGELAYRDPNALFAVIKREYRPGAGIRRSG